MARARVSIVNYGVGNLLSAARALTHVGADVTITGDRNDIASADRLVLPGVGAFGHCMDILNEGGVGQSVQAFVQSGRPFLGICVGMQVLFDYSEEFGPVAGLSLVPGAVRRIPDQDVQGKPQKVPHIGWSALSPSSAEAGWGDTPLADTNAGDATYFVHSYTAWPNDDENRLADAWHGGQRICAAVRKDNIFGVQFHPEKSGAAGLAILRNFIRI